MHKADLTNWKTYNESVRSQQMSYAYYSALFCRMLYYLETEIVDDDFIRKCNDLLSMYDWYSINEEEIAKFRKSGQDKNVWYKSEISELLETSMPELDKNTDGEKCLICTYYDNEGECHARWEAADVRGSVK